MSTDISLELFEPFKNHQQALHTSVDQETVPEDGTIHTFSKKKKKRKWYQKKWCQMNTNVTISTVCIVPPRHNTSVSCSIVWPLMSKPGRF